LQKRSMRWVVEIPHVGSSFVAGHAAKPR
jgi:hypothetical protein